MKNAYFAHHYLLLRYRNCRTEEEKTKLARSYFDQMAEEVDKAMKGALEHETTIIVATSGVGEVTAYRA